jgi:ATP-dependent DNA helicase Rep
VNRPRAPRARGPGHQAKLNPAQQRAVEHLGGPLLVLAGAGSGKTRVIATKVAHLVRRAGHAPGSVAAVTFTNKAAREMRERVAAALGRETAAELLISTFHTLGLRILREEHARVGLGRGFTILDADDQRALIGDALRQSAGGRADPDDAVERALWRISDWKSGLSAPAAAAAGARDPLDRRAAAAYLEYERALKAYSAVDFDDLIGLPVKVLTEHAAVRDAWRARLRYLLVDEYQDTNSAQYALLKLLAGPQGNFTVVGDDDQSVYAWRGARPENLRELAADYPALEVVKLEQNYRCTNRILRAANALIANNTHLFEKKLWSTHDEGAPIRVAACRDAEHEVAWVVGEIMLLAQRGARWGEIAVLYRGNHQARAFEQVLREQRVPYQVSGGSSFLERSEVRDLVAYLRLAANPSDDAAFLRVVNVPKRELGATSIEKLAAAAAASRQGLFAAARSAEGQAAVGPRAAGPLAEFTRAVTLAAATGATDPVAALRDLIERIGYADWLAERAEDEGAARRKQESVDELIAWTARVVRDLAADPARAAGAQGVALAEALARMSLLDMLERQEEEADQERVQLMTLHSAKGLEFAHVFLVGFEEELIPHRNSAETPAGVAEERRLAYVGITRAAKTLSITHAAERKRWGEVSACAPSRFLQELPADDLEWRGGEKADPAEARERGRAHLKALRARYAEPDAPADGSTKDPGP